MASVAERHPVERLDDGFILDHNRAGTSTIAKIDVTARFTDRR
jgi:hypothetical protein